MVWWISRFSGLADRVSKWNLSLVASELWIREQEYEPTVTLRLSMSDENDEPRLCHILSACLLASRAEEDVTQGGAQ